MGGNGRAATIPPSGVEAESRGKTRILARGSAGPALRWPADASQREAFHQGRCQDAPGGAGIIQKSFGAFCMTLRRGFRHFYDDAHGQRVLRGGAWNNCGPKSLLSSYREHAAPERFSVVTGFRCVLSANP